MCSALFSAALFSALAAAQFSIDRPLVSLPLTLNHSSLLTPPPQESRVISDGGAFVSSLTANPALASDLSAIQKVAPTTVIAAAKTDPIALMNAIAADTPNTSLIAQIPTPVVQSLQSLLAKPIKAVTDIGTYLSQLFASPGVAQTLVNLGNQVPPKVQEEIVSNPVPFVENLITATTVPAWVTAVPAPVQEQLASVLNKGLSIIAADLEGKTVTFPAATGALPTRSFQKSGTVAGATGKGYAAASAGSPVKKGPAPTGGAQSVRTGVPSSKIGSSPPSAVQPVGAGVSSLKGSSPRSAIQSLRTGGSSSRRASATSVGKAVGTGGVVAATGSGSRGSGTNSTVPFLGGGSSLRVTIAGVVGVVGGVVALMAL